MKKGWIIGGAVLLVVFILYRLFAGSYNNLVEKEEGVTKQWAQVENSYQRRADLIPNLVNTVKGYADFEKSTLEAVITARSRATGITVDPTNLTPDKIQQFQQAQDYKHNWRVLKTAFLLSVESLMKWWRPLMFI